MQVLYVKQPPTLPLPPKSKSNTELSHENVSNGPYTTTEPKGLLQLGTVLICS